jgi:hypothetical protein
MAWPSAKCARETGLVEFVGRCAGVKRLYSMDQNRLAVFGLIDQSSTNELLVA